MLDWLWLDETSEMKSTVPNPLHNFTYWTNKTEFPDLVEMGETCDGARHHSLEDGSMSSWG
jgi:hypothetical protein